MTYSTRANALPETALAMSVVLLVTLGVIELGLIGYGQAQIDGASFVAAHEAAYQDPGNQVWAGKTRATSTFTHLKSSQVQVYPGSSATHPDSVTGQPLAAAFLTGLGNFVGQGLNANLRSHAIEPGVGLVPDASAASPLVVTAALQNCDTTSTGLTYSTCKIQLANLDLTVLADNGDPLAQYKDHLGVYQQLAAGGANPWPLMWGCGRTVNSINNPLIRNPPDGDGSLFLNADGSLGSILSQIYNFDGVDLPTPVNNTPARC